MLKYILPIVGRFPFDLYCEPFCGGAAVCFALHKSRKKSYILNDLNEHVVNFYRQAKSNPTALAALTVERGIVSRKHYERAIVVFNAPVSADNALESAWATLYILYCSWIGFLDGKAMFYPKFQSVMKITQAAREINRFCDKLQECGIECMDALQCVRQYDSPTSLFYVDPPYVGTQQFHYDGYAQSDLDALLECLLTIKGRFILSHYNNPALREWAADNKLQCDVFQTKSTLTMGGGNNKREELLIYNYGKEGLF